jgi:hypothetical protein
MRAKGLSSCSQNPATLAPIMTQMNSLHTLTPYFFKSQFLTSSMHDTDPSYPQLSEP